MTKLVAVLALSLAFAGCKNKEDQAATPGSAATVPSATTPPAAEAIAGLPAECATFKALADRLATCEKLAPEVRQGIRSSWVMMTKTLKMGGDDEATQKANCTKAADALKTLEKDCP